jgi:hypothetical protein
MANESERRTVGNEQTYDPHRQEELVDATHHPATSNLQLASRMQFSLDPKVLFELNSAVLEFLLGRAVKCRKKWYGLV